MSQPSEWVCPNYNLDEAGPINPGQGKEEGNQHVNKFIEENELRKVIIMDNTAL